MRILTLRQPWATLIALGFKRVETRSWPTDYRGPLAIHAGLRWARVQRRIAVDLWELLELGDLFPDVADPLEILGGQLGQVVALTELASCVQMTPESVAAAGPVEVRLGDWRPGRWAWGVAGARPLTGPLAVTGMLGLRAVGPSFAADVRLLAGEVPLE